MTESEKLEQFQSCLEKQDKIKKKFVDCSDAESCYFKIMELGKEQPSIEEQYKSEENRVKGCQSQMYLHSRLDDGKIFFETEADALISAGLGVLLAEVYSGESPEAVLKCAPLFLEELQINASLSPSRANGLASLHLKMKQDALKALLSA